MCAGEYHHKWWHALLDNSADWDAAFANPPIAPEDIRGLYSRLPGFTVPGNKWKISFRSQADRVYGGSTQFTWSCINKPTTTSTTTTTMTTTTITTTTTSTTPTTTTTGNSLFSYR